MDKSTSTVAPVGFEPTTSELKAPCSAVELEGRPISFCTPDRIRTCTRTQSALTY